MRWNFWLAGLLAGWWWSTAALAEEPVTITVLGEARPDSEIASEPFVATSRVRRERLRAPGLRATDVLRSEAGVQIAEAGGLGAPATASIRGASSAQTPVYLGGVRLNDQVGGVVDLSTIPLWLIERVDLYRGNAPFDADELGIGGAIFFEPRRPRTSEVALGATLGSFGTRSGFGYFALGDERAGVLAGVSAERADNDYEIADDRGTLFDPSDDSTSRRKNSDTRLFDVWWLGRARLGERGRVELTVNHVQREQGVPKLALVPSRSARAELSRNLAALTSKLWLDVARSRLLTLRTSLLDGSSVLDDPEREIGALSRRTDVVGRRLEQQALVEAALAERFRLALGGSGSFETLSREDEASSLSARASTLRGLTRLDFSASRALTLLGVVSAQCRGTQPGGGGCGDVEPTGRVGLGVRLGAVTAFANASRYQRQPALGELYGVGPLVRGNRRLLPELGVGVDAGARGAWRWGAFRAQAEAAAFARRASELVTYARTAQGYVLPINVGQARIVGLELGAGVRAFEHVQADCNVTLLDPRDTTPGRRLVNDFLPFSSRLVLAPRLLVTTGDRPGSTLKRAELAADLSYLSSRFADPAGLIVIPEQATLGLSGSASWLAGALVSRARLANLLNTARFDIVGYPLPGRSLYVSLEVRQ